MSAEDTAGRSPGATGGPGETSAPRRYDSFHVRLWTQPGTERLLRAEVRHIQTNLAETATAVQVSWLLEAVRALLAGAPSSADGPPPQ